MQHVCQRLLAARTHDEAGMGAGGIEKLVNRLGDRSVVAPVPATANRSLGLDEHGLRWCEE